MTSVFGRTNVCALTAEQSTEWDRNAREQDGIPERVLMENAGRALASAVQAFYPRGRVLALAGSGHNGGDALVAARTLHNWGRDVAWVAAGSRAPQLDVLHGHTVARVNDARIELELARADVIIDGILGTGARGAPHEPVANLIRAVNASQRPVVAVDLPSGADATSGRVEGEAVQANLTVTFGAAKVGLLLHPARRYCGRLIVVEIGFPPNRSTASAQRITPSWAWRHLPRRAPDAHKGTAGRLLLVAGSQGMAGAAAIAGHACVRAGAGLVRIASAAVNRDVIQRLVPEATYFDYADELPAQGVHALIVGCGLGTDNVARDVLERALSNTKSLPTLADADALNLLGKMPERIREIAAERPLLITPHVRELSRISGVDEASILRDPLGCANHFAGTTGAVVLLKGQPSVVAAARQPIMINTVGSSALATAGMGDQLAGVAGAFLAAGVAPREAAALGLFYGARAADLSDMGRSLSPRDASDFLAAAFRSPGRRRPPFGLPFVAFDQPQRR